MRSAIRKWGNSLALRIPRAVAEEAEMIDGTEVEISIEGGQVIITSVSAVPSLKDLVDGITPANLHGAVSTGRPQGRERW